MTGVFEGLGSLQFSPDNKFCYAFSPAIDANTAIATMLEFTTESEYIQAAFQYGGYMGPDGGSSSAGTRGICSIYFNDIRVYQVLADTDSGNMAQTIYVELIIPPFTKVTVKTTASSSTTDYVAQIAITGKVHGAIQQENLEAISNNNKWASL